MKNEKKEIADVAFEVVGDVAENAHAEMERERHFKKLKRGVKVETETFATKDDVKAYLTDVVDIDKFEAIDVKKMRGIYVIEMVTPIDYDA